MPRTLKKREAPVSLRLTEAERQAVKSQAGRLPLSTYIKQVLFADGRSSLRRLPRQAAGNPVLLTRILAQLGGTQITKSLATLAEAAESGSLYVDDLVARRLNDACDDVRAMHLLLLEALGKKRPNAPRKAQRVGAQFAEAAHDPQARP